MKTSNKSRKVISFPADVFELLQTVQSGYQLVHKTSITYPELVRLLIEKGLESTEPKVYQVIQLLNMKEENQVKEQATESVGVPEQVEQN